jgi:hypothetical protein
MSEHKAFIGNVLTAVVTAAILGVLGWALGVFNAGSDALTEAEIKRVITETLVLDDGLTYAATLDSIDKSVGEINVSIGFIKDDIEDLEDSVAILVAE